jgi:hypothetical protein
VLRHRLLLLLMCATVSAALLSAMNSAAAVNGSHRHRAPVRRSLPTIWGKPEAGDLLRAYPGRWNGASKFSYRWERCNTRGARCKVIDRSKRGHAYSARTYKLTKSDIGHRIRVTVLARNAWGQNSANSRATAVIEKAGSLGTTLPSSQTGYPPPGYPRPDATCAAEVRPVAENRPDNTTANNTVPTNPTAITWDPGTYWSKWIYDRNQVTGNYTGTTDEILQWAACKWGVDENIVRAAAAEESRWHQSTVGDNCGVAGEASYGILQVKNKDCSGNWVHGGWPDTQNDTALAADTYAAHLRACFDGAFYDGGTWLYGGQTIAQVIAAHGEDYALWGCVGAWYSGNWYDSGAQSYISSVQNYYASKPWLNPGF